MKTFSVFQKCGYVWSNMFFDYYRKCSNLLH